MEQPYMFDVSPSLASVLAALFGAITSIIVSWLALQTAKLQRIQESQHISIKELAHNTNDIKDELVRATAMASRAEGIALGRKQIHEEQKVTSRDQNVSDREKAVTVREERQDPHR